MGFRRCSLSCRGLGVQWVSYAGFCFWVNWFRVYGCTLALKVRASMVGGFRGPGFVGAGVRRFGIQANPKPEKEP